MLTKERIIDLLREQSAYLAREFGIRKIGLFGSFVRGAETERSDIDLVVEFERPIGLRFVEMVEYLENLLGRRVEVLTPAGVQEIRRKSIVRNIGKAWQVCAIA
jgi:hypothetical protein